MPGSKTKKQLAVEITERLIGTAPLNLIKPQILELSNLRKKQLLVLLKIARFPVPAKNRASIVEELGSEAILQRMEKRWRIARAICQAEKEGLYEAAEHISGSYSCEN